MNPVARSSIARPVGWLLPLAAALVPGSARAHGSLAIGDFYSGMLDPLLHFETLLPTLALALWSGQRGMPDGWRFPLCFLLAVLLGAGAGVLGSEFAAGPSLLKVSMLMLGLLVAARLGLPAPLAMALVALFGFATGQGHTFEPGARIERPALFVAGIASSVALILYHVARNVLLYRAFWVQTGVRVLGSWIAATGLLVLVLEWTPRS